MGARMICGIGHQQREGPEAAVMIFLMRQVFRVGGWRTGNTDVAAWCRVSYRCARLSPRASQSVGRIVCEDRLGREERST